MWLLVKLFCFQLMLQPEILDGEILDPFPLL
jgi:hypothetical protein